MNKNIIDKIWDTHIIQQKQGHPAILAIDFCLVHEVTSAQAFDTLREKSLALFNPKSLLATVDHSIPTRQNRHEIFDPMAKAQLQKLRDNTVEFTVPFYDMDSSHQGIVHVIGPELGITQPGGRPAGKAFIGQLQVFSHLANVGDAKSLVIHPASTTHQQMDAEALKNAGISEGMIRLSVGIEDADDLIKDLKLGLRAAGKVADKEKAA